MRKEKTKRKLKQNLFYKIVSGMLLLMSIIFISILCYVNLLPTKYLALIIIVLIIFVVFNIFLLFLPKLKKKIKKIVTGIVILVIIVMMLGSFYICKTLGVLSNNGDSKYKLEHYSVMVLKTSKYNKLKDIKDEEVGYYKNSTGATEANERLKKEINIKFNPYNSADTLVKDLLDSKVNCILIEDSIKNIMDEEVENFSKSVKVIYKFTIKVKVESTLKDVDVTKKPFAVYVSGIDTYGQISSVSRSDVNIVMVINPKTKQVLLISIPRDYYVQLHGTTGVKDKLTHAGIYGIDMSIKTIEDLLDLKINYYLKVNFTSVIDIVGALGGLDVYSEYTFTSYSGYSFKEGYNAVNGEQALDFARTRKAFSDGDRQRGKNQQALIESIIRKATNKSIITKYSSLLNAINGKYQTNMSTKKITSLVKMQLNDMAHWNVTSYSLSGKDSNNYTYTYNQLLYVMQPELESVDEAASLIDKVINGEKLDASYSATASSSNRVGKVRAYTDSEPSVQSDSRTSTTPKTPEAEPTKHIVRFNLNGGEEKYNDQELSQGQSIKFPGTPTKEGYDFKGWIINGNLYTDITISDVKVDRDITAIAKWEEKDEPIESLTPSENEISSNIEEENSGEEKV